MPNEKVNPRPAGEDFDEVQGNDRRAEPDIKRPNEPGLNRDRDPQTEEPAVKPADEVSEGR